MGHNSRLPRWAAPQRHAVKMINLRSNRIPAPDQLVGVHIDQIERADMFGWTPDGILKMDRESIPQLTVVHLKSHPIDRRRIRFAGRDADCDAEYVAAHRQLAPTPQLDEIKQLASQWTSGVPQGWPQVEAVIANLRASYQYDHKATVRADADDALGHFLFQSRRGPDYLFASSAAIMLRCLGYPTRMVSGFYARPDRYDREARQTIVLKEDVHFWAEVCVDGRTWVAVEPTPGYELLPPPRTLAEKIAATFVGIVRWTWQHKVTSLMVLALLISGVAFRRTLIDCLMVLSWRIACFAGSRRQVKATIWLLEHRAWLSGCPRPATQTINTWYSRLQSDNPYACEVSTMKQMLSLANQVLYAPDFTHDAGSTNNICRRVIADWTVRRLRQRRRQEPK